MKFIRQILKQSLCFSLGSGRFYSIRNMPIVCTSEEKNNYRNALKTEDDKSHYYFEDGLRKVYPYYSTFSIYCKGRWFNRKLVDAFHEVYAHFPREEIVFRVSEGLLKVNNKVVSTDYVLKRNDLVTSTVHRHELSVLGCPITILFEDDDFLVIDKPPSLPVYPCGLYAKNSVLSILATEYNKHDLHVLFRLDRLTSGVLVFAKSVEKSREICKEVIAPGIKKAYVCRVEGNFPEGIVVCDKPIKDFYYQIGACLVHPEGKVARTDFKKLSYNGKSSVVLCKPYTGRTHQIRVHLQYLGHPILNDPVYNSSVFGPHKGKDGILGTTITQMLDDLCKEHALGGNLKSLNRISKLPNEYENIFLKYSIFKEYYRSKDKPDYKKDCSKILKDENCYFCRTVVPEQRSLGIFLHAYKYQGCHWRFESDIPFWAAEDWDVA